MAEEPKYVFGRLNKKYAVFSGVKHTAAQASPKAKAAVAKAHAKRTIKKKAKKLSWNRAEAAAITKRQKSWYK